MGFQQTASFDAGPFHTCALCPITLMQSQLALYRLAAGLLGTATGTHSGHSLLRLAEIPLRAVLWREKREIWREVCVCVCVCVYVFVCVHRGEQNEKVSVRSAFLSSPLCAQRKWTCRRHSRSTLQLFQKYLADECNFFFYSGYHL